MDAEEIARSVVVCELVVFEINSGGSVGNIEGVALVGGDVRIFGGKGGFSVGGVAGHRLVEEDIFISGGLAV